jgi:hypothetical protein
MAINWGTKIFMLYTGFVLFICTLVWKSMHTNVDLVSEDYYEQEVTFQRKLNAQTATMQLSQKPVIITTLQAILIFFPREFHNKQIKADVHLYDPANAALDKAFVALQAEQDKLEISRKNIPAASYTVQLSWQCEGRKYYQEFPLNLAAL